MTQEPSMCDDPNHDHLAREVGRLTRALENASQQAATSAGESKVLRAELALTRKVLEQAQATVALYTSAIPRERRHGH